MKVLISGAGIGGLAAALRLRDLGHDVTVLEKTPEPKDIGGGILVPPNSMRILQTLGLSQAIESVGWLPQSRQVIRWKDASLIAEAPLGDGVREQYGAPFMVMHRADLHRTLLDAVAEPNKEMKDVDVRFGIDIVRAESEGAGGVAIDADGNQYKADVIIGADGLHSNIRKSIGIFDEPTFEGNILWWSLIPIEDLRKDPMHAWLEPRLAVWVGPERHVVHFLVRRGEFLMLAAIVPWEEEMPESWSAVGDRDAAIEPFEVWDEKLYKLMQLAKEVHPWPLLDRNPFDYWTQGRIALLGDACHPMLPHQAQGAAQSVEDAWILAEKLTEADTSSVEEALKAYEEARKPRATVIQQASRDHGEAYHLPDGPDQQKRDEIMAKNFGNAVVTFDWLWGGTPDSLPPKD